MRILVADDHVDSAATMAALLRAMGHEVETAQNPAQALERARVMRPQLIFLDIGLPQMDGWQLAPLLRRELADQSVVIVAVSGFADNAAHVLSRKAGLDAHVSKPVDFALLRSILLQMRRAS